MTRQLRAWLTVGLAVALGLSPGAARGQGRPVAAGVATVEFLDVGQGDAIFVRSAEGKTALIDAGPSNAVVGMLKRRGVRSLDMVAVSHHHADHYGGMEAVIREFEPRLFLTTNSPHTTPLYLRLLKLVRDRQIRTAFPADTPRRIELGTLLLTVLPQPPEDPRDENDNSMGVRVQYGTFSVLLTGDSEAGERRFWERNAPQFVANCTVLKVAHHGSRNGLDDHWLETTRPKLAVASLGRDNGFGHPHPETLARLARRQVPLLRTDRDGTVAVVSDGQTWGEAVGREPVRVSPPAARASRPKSATARAARRPVRPVDVNRAAAAELELVPGVGPEMARRIIEGRPYRSVDDLLRVKGIGQKRLGEFRPYLKAG